MDETKNIPPKENNSNVDTVNEHQLEILNINKEKETKMEIPIVKDKLKINDVPEDDSKKMIQKMMGHLVNKLLPELKPRD